MPWINSTQWFVEVMLLHRYFTDCLFSVGIIAEFHSNHSMPSKKKSLFLFHFSTQFLWFTDYFSIFIFSLLLFYSKKNQLIDFINFENELLKLPCDSVNENHSCTSTVFYFHFIRRVIHNSKFIGMLHNLNTIKPINELIKKFCTPLLRIFFTYLMHSKCLNAYSCLPSQVIKAISNYKSITIVMLHTLTPNTPSR